ncbi:MAG: hypothetical protein ABJD97_01230 [Betaproteobacteria bacterium]
MKVAVLGASVSAQTVRHDTGEVAGYCEVLRRQWLGAIGAASLTQICYAGSRLSDGGLYRVGHVIGHQPDICIVEPLVEDNRRGRATTRDEAVFVYRSLLRRRILPVVLFLPDPAKRTPRKWANFELHQDLCQVLGLPCIEVDLSAAGDLDGMFVGLHTRLGGAELYAREIVNGLQAIGDRPAIIEKALQAAAEMRLGLHETTVATPERARVSTIALSVRPRTPGEFGYRVVQAQQVGPFSPKIAVDASGPPTQGEALRSVWDPYCHFERRAWPVLDDRHVGAPGLARTVTITLSPFDPDYATSLRAVASWPGVVDRSLRPAGPIKVFSTVPVDVELLAYE